VAIYSCFNSDPFVSLFLLFPLFLLFGRLNKKETTSPESPVQIFMPRLKMEDSDEEEEDEEDEDEEDEEDSKIEEGQKGIKGIPIRGPADKENQARSEVNVRGNAAAGKVVGPKGVVVKGGNNAKEKDERSPPHMLSEKFFLWRIGHTGLQFELPSYYQEAKEATFRGNGLYWFVLFFFLFSHFSSSSSSSFSFSFPLCRLAC